MRKKKFLLLIILFSIMWPSLGQIIDTIFEQHVYCHSHDQIEHLNGHNTNHNITPNSKTSNAFTRFDKLESEAKNSHSLCLISNILNHKNKFSLINQSNNVEFGSFTLNFFKRIENNLFTKIIAFAPKNSPPYFSLS